MEIIEDIVDNGHGFLNPSYLFVHSTANPGATAKNHRDLYASGDWKYSVQYVCDWTNVVYHCMPDDRLAYAVGNGNKYGVNLEICEGRNQAEFNGSWNTAVEFCAYYLNKRDWNIDHMMSHDECTKKWGGSDHTDPIPYFRKYGKTWQQFKDAVAAKMNNESEDELINVVIPQGTYNVYRAYNTKTGAHFYTSSKTEYDNLGSNWNKEGIGWKSVDTGAIVYRLKNPNDGTYMFTTSYDEAISLVKASWKAEGINFSSARNGKPVYRLYNPNAGDHFFTVSDDEKNNLVKAGWKYEGIAFYAA